jgi:hypothetical protein
MRDSAGIAVRIGSTVSATVILLLPAIWNGFPILEWDTGGYLARWFEGYLVPSRSTTYGLFLAAAWPLVTHPARPCPRVYARAGARIEVLKNFGLVPLRCRHGQRCRALAVIMPIMPTSELVWLGRHGAA